MAAVIKPTAAFTNYHRWVLLLYRLDDSRAQRILWLLEEVS